jgi:hypothetical protein
MFALVLSYEKLKEIEPQQTFKTKKTKEFKDILRKRA